MHDDALIWIDGKAVRAGEASVSVLDHGLVVGDGAFETLKIVRGTPFAMSRHIRRLHTTLAALSIAPPSVDSLRDAMEQATAGNDLSYGKLRLTVTAGSGPLGSGSPHGPARVIVAAQAPDERPPPSSVTVPWTRNESGALAGLKTTSYAENVRALRYAHELGAGEALFANTRGQLCEGTGTNVFVAVDGELLTPPLSSGCLGGITRELVLELTDVHETDLPLDVLISAEEVFLTSSTRDVHAMEGVDDRSLGEPGPITLEVASAFRALVADDLDP